MSKILLYTDCHWCNYSSIVRKRGSFYSARLENLIRSVNWAEKQAVDNGCSAVICLGDFFDKNELNGEELTSLQELVWANVPHYFVVGNHEMHLSSLMTSSAHILGIRNNLTVVDEPTLTSIDGRSCLFLPYILNNDERKMQNYVKNKVDIVFSHNDIAGIQMGQFISKEGFELSDIKSNCSMFLNGHIHNGGFVDTGVFNLGNLTGQNFSEDGFKYSHNTYILDTDSMSVTAIPNPYAFNFYKVDCCEEGVSALSNLEHIDNNTNKVVSVRCKQKDIDYVRETLNKNKDVVEYRVISVADVKEHEVVETQSVSVDHVQKFKEYCLSSLEKSDYLLYELQEICK